MAKLVARLAGGAAAEALWVRIQTSLNKNCLFWTEKNVENDYDSYDEYIWVLHTFKIDAKQILE